MLSSSSVPQISSKVWEVACSDASFEEETIFFLSYVRQQHVVLSRAECCRGPGE